MITVNRQKFMQELRSLIYFMRPADKESALSSYEAQFEAAGPEGEAALIQELGSPLKQIVLLEREYRSKMAAEEELQEPDSPAMPPEETPLSPEEPELGTAASIPDEEQDAIRLPDMVPEKPEIFVAQKPRKEPVSAGRIVLAVLVTMPLLPLTMLALVVSIVLCAIPLVPGAGLGACGVYLIAFGIVVMGYIPDILMLIGAGLAGLAVALVLVWFGIWLLILSLRLILNILRSVYRGILRGGASNV